MTNRNSSTDNSIMVPSDKFGEWLRETNYPPSQVTVPKSSASAWMKTISANGAKITSWKDQGTNPMTTTISFERIGLFKPPPGGPDPWTAEGIKLLDKALKDLASVNVKKALQLQDVLAAKKAKPAPAEDFHSLRKKFITGEGSVEQKEAMLAKVTLRVDASGVHHWDPDPDVKLWDPPSPHVDGWKLSKADYLRREGLLPRKKSVPLRPGTWTTVWVAAAVLMVAQIAVGNVTYAVIEFMVMMLAIWMRWMVS